MLLAVEVTASRAPATDSVGNHWHMALDLPCPDCGTQMYAEQAHNRCPACLYIEPCCDGAPQPCPTPATVPRDSGD